MCLLVQSKEKQLKSGKAKSGGVGMKNSVLKSSVWNFQSHIFATTKKNFSNALSLPGGIIYTSRHHITSIITLKKLIVWQSSVGYLSYSLFDWNVRHAR